MPSGTPAPARYSQPAQHSSISNITAEPRGRLAGHRAPSYTRFPGADTGGSLLQTETHRILHAREYGAVADMGKAWTSIKTLARDLMAPPAQQAPGAAGVAAAVAVHVDLASLLAAAQGAPAGVAVAAGSLADEKASFMAFMSENYAKLAEEQLTALAFYKKFKSRIPKIAVV